MMLLANFHANYALGNMLDIGVMLLHVVIEKAFRTPRGPIILYIFYLVVRLLLLSWTVEFLRELLTRT